MLIEWKQASIVIGAALCVAAGAGITYIGTNSGPADSQQGAARDAVPASGADDAFIGREIVVIDEDGQEGPSLSPALSVIGSGEI